MNGTCAISISTFTFTRLTVYWFYLVRSWIDKRKHGWNMQCNNTLVATCSAWATGMRAFIRRKPACTLAMQALFFGVSALNLNDLFAALTAGLVSVWMLTCLLHLVWLRRNNQLLGCPNEVGAEPSISCVGWYEWRKAHAFLLRFCGGLYFALGAAFAESAIIRVCALAACLWLFARLACCGCSASRRQ